MPPALPGFHYDAKKKKYFKVQPNHVAAHGSARQYSKAALQKEAEERREQKLRTLLEQREKKTRLQRSRVLQSPLGGGWGVLRELGLVAKPDGGTAMLTRAWAQGLAGKPVVSFGCSPDGASGKFVFDSATGVLTYVEAICEGGGNLWCTVFVLLLICGSFGGAPGKKEGGKCDADADDGYFL